MNKTCTKCGNEHPLTAEFWSKDRRYKCGYGSWCKKCISIYGEKYRSKHVKESKQANDYYYSTLKGHLSSCYRNINRRCNNPECRDYGRYGGRGVCNLFTSFQDFFNHITLVLGITDIEQIKNLDLDRINNGGNYERGNIRFCTHKENMNNRTRPERMVRLEKEVVAEYKRGEVTMQHLADKHGIDISSVSKWLKKGIA